MKVDAELEATGFHGKARAKFFNRIWHPYLPRKVSAMQWLILAEGLPVGAWRERIGQPSNCQLYITGDRETLQHAFNDCTEIKQVWEYFRNTRRAAGLQTSYNSWNDISIGLMMDIPGPSIEEELRWDAAAAFIVTMETPWDILRAQLLWAIWCQRVEFAFREVHFHLGVVLWHAWRNTIYCAMEAYRELFRHARNEEKRQEAIACFRTVWTASNIFGRLQQGDIKWNLTPHKEFLLEFLAAWTAPPIRIHRLSPSPDTDAELAARPDFGNLVDSFIQNIADSIQRQAPEVEHNPDPQADTTNQEQEEIEDYGTSPTRGLGSHPNQQTSAQQSSQLRDREGSENQTDTQTYRNQVRSRPKKRCPRRLRHPMHRASDPAAPRGCGPLQGHTETSARLPPKSRLKTKCRFGPLRKRGRTRLRSEEPTRREAPPSPPPSDRRTTPPLGDHHQHHLSSITRTQINPHPTPPTIQPQHIASSSRGTMTHWRLPLQEQDPNQGGLHLAPHRRGILPPGDE
jgi:hypothetical protein